MNTGKMPQGMTPITPCLTLKDVDAALDFYSKAFGFTLLHKMDCPVSGKTGHAHMMHGTSGFMLGAENPTCSARQPEVADSAPSALYVYVEDVDKFFENATAQGAKVKDACKDMFWGDRVCSLIDPFGYHWTFGTFVREVSPEDMKTAMLEMMKQETPV